MRCLARDLLVTPAPLGCGSVRYQLWHGRLISMRSLSVRVHVKRGSMIRRTASTQQRTDSHHSIATRSTWR